MRERYREKVCVRECVQNSHEGEMLQYMYIILELRLLSRK